MIDLIQTDPVSLNLRGVRLSLREPPRGPGLQMTDDPSTAPAVADSLALALVASSDAPILLLNGDFTVIAASDSFSRSFQIEPAAKDREAHQHSAFILRQ